MRVQGSIHTWTKPNFLTIWQVSSCQRTHVFHRIFISKYFTSAIFLPLTTLWCKELVCPNCSGPHLIKANDPLIYITFSHYLNYHWFIVHKISQNDVQRILKWWILDWVFIKENSFEIMIYIITLNSVNGDIFISRIIYKKMTFLSHLTYINQCQLRDVHIQKYLQKMSFLSPLTYQTLQLLWYTICIKN